MFRGDGRCLFRALVRGKQLQTSPNSHSPADETAMSDALRKEVVAELRKRRSEIEWAIEGDFETYCRSMELPGTWGGEPELLMASRCMNTDIDVFVIRQPAVKGRGPDVVRVQQYQGHHDGDGDTSSSTNVSGGRPVEILLDHGHYSTLQRRSRL